MNFKYTSFIVGLILFVGITYFFFSMTSEGAADYGSNNTATYTTLAGNYDIVESLTTDESNSTLRKMQSRLEDAEYNTIAGALAAADKALDASKLIIESIKTTERVGNLVLDSSNTKIPPIFKTMAIGIITILIILALLYMLMRWKAES